PPARGRSADPPLAVRVSDDLGSMGRDGADAVFDAEPGVLFVNKDALGAIGSASGGIETPDRRSPDPRRPRAPAHGALVSPPPSRRPRRPSLEPPGGSAHPGIVGRDAMAPHHGFHAPHPGWPARRRPRGGL